LGENSVIGGSGANSWWGGSASSKGRSQPKQRVIREKRVIVESQAEGRTKKEMKTDENRRKARGKEKISKARGGQTIETTPW